MEWLSIPITFVVSMVVGFFGWPVVVFITQRIRGEK